MRPAVVAGIVLAVLPAAAPAQNGPRYATVTDAQATLKAGPSPNYPEAGTLPAGTRVVVDHEDQGGWLAVVAPPGAVSWVPTALVTFDRNKPTPQLVTVEEPTALAAGRPGLGQPLAEVQRVRLPAGTVLTVIGPKVEFGGKGWYPVIPPDEDYRYLPKTAVQVGGSANTSFVVKETAPTGLTPIEARVPAGGSADPFGAPARSGVPNPLWAQAEEAERAGRYDDAEKLFFQVAKDADADLANRCFARIHTLREKSRGGAGLVAGGGRPSAEPVSPGRTATLLPPVREDRRDERRPESPGQPAAADRAGWSGVMTLMKSPLALDGRQTYALESSPGVVVGYAVPAPGLDLSGHIGRRIRVYGTTYTHRNTPKPYTVVTDVQAER